MKPEPRPHLTDDTVTATSSNVRLARGTLPTADPTNTMTEIVHSQTSLPPVGPVARC